MNFINKLKIFNPSLLLHIVFLSVICIFYSGIVSAQTDLFYYLPENTTLNHSIPKPSSVTGFEIGQTHLSHDQLVYFFYQLDKSSTRVKVEKYGKTYENRPLLNVIISSEENMSHLDEIRQQHLELSDPALSKNIDISDMPLIVRLGYTVHGNEASGANASVLVAYYLAAAQGKEIDNLLSKTIILIDPCLNPDGYQRFSSWVNENKSKNPNPDPNNREANEPWPNGRTNHYWFDLNRDWLPAQHPESVGRLIMYHYWKPNIQTDHHEMGRNSTFFFQPGVPSRNHPLVPAKAYELTDKIAAYHASALSKNQRLFFSKENFDDFYFGKGSTYPDINGGIGILFEQASPRGLVRETINGIITFPYAIKNQFLVSMSTLKAGFELRNELLEYQRSFYQTALKDADKKKFKAYVFGKDDDPYRSAKLAQMLQRHKITLYKPSADISINGDNFKTDASYVVPLNQPQQRLITNIFERRTVFLDSLFYDVSAWTMDLAFGMDIDVLMDKNFIGKEIESIEFPKGYVDAKSKYAYAIKWQSYMAPALVNQLLKRDIRLKVATQSFTDKESIKYNTGTIILPVGTQDKPGDDIFDLLEKYAVKYGVQVHALQSGTTITGPDLGSNSFRPLQKLHIILLTGKGVNSYEAGEVWHLLDQRLDIHVTMAETARLRQINLTPYNVIMMPNGSYSSLTTQDAEKIKEWVKEGGTLIAWKQTLKWLKKNKLAEIEFIKPKSDSIKMTTYADMDKAKGAQRIGGAIFNTDADLTHPLLYGYSNPHIPVFRNSTLMIKPSNSQYANPIHYTGEPLLSGYISKQNNDLLKNTPTVYISKYGSGKIIAFIDDNNFRAFWYGTNRLTINSIFFGSIIRIR